ncbi:MAG: GNAT family N-acetyltransferase [Clostridia bacterium]|nr:GNAT family N-acetyltransferase [Clostridia bacterium]
MNNKKLIIEKLHIEDFEKCQNIWDMKSDPEQRDSFYNELKNGNRITFICKDENNNFLGEGSLVFECKYKNFTTPKKRIYLSHLHVNPECRGQGIGTLLCNHIFNYCKENGYSEISLVVQLSNYNAMRLYHRLGFITILDLLESQKGKSLGVLKKLD